MIAFRLLSYSLAAVTIVALVSGAETPLNEPTLHTFLEKHCLRCHGANKQKAQIRFDTLDFSISDSGEALHYQDFLDVLNSGEMPPEDEDQPSRDELEVVIAELTEGLFRARKNLASTGGKVAMRRLNRREYAATIDRLFGFVPAPSKIPPDGDVVHFDTVGSRQHFTTEHMSQYYELGQQVLESAYKWAGKREPMKIDQQEPETFWNAHFRDALEKWKDTKTGKVVRLSKDRREYLALPKVETGVYLSEPLRHLQFRFGVDPRARYRISVVAGIEGEVAPFRRFIRVGSSDGIAGVFRVDGTSDVPSESSVEIRPLALNGDTIGGRVNEDRTGAWFSHYLSSLKHYEGVDATSQGMIWIDSFKIEGPFYPDERSFFDRLLYPDISTKYTWDDGNARKLIERFTKEAFRQKPLESTYIDGLVDYFHAQRDKGSDYQRAMIDTLAIVLASPSFVFLNEDANADPESRSLSPRDTAIRLSYFLTSGPPDRALMDAAAAGAMTDREAYHREVSRILSVNNRQFAEGFSSQWADFVRLDSISVSKHFPTYAGGLKHSMKQEVIAYFQAMIEHNLPIAKLIESNFATVNAQLAVHYGIPGVTSNDFQPVKLPADSPRGGFLTQAAFLVAGSNGERTSPAVRGMKLLEKVYNAPPPPPPPNVPEIGAGIDGPASNRQLVELHQSQVQCASCHRKMDTIGLALENFDVIGRWRDIEKTSTRTTEPIVIDGALPDEDRFTSFAEFRRSLLNHEADFARHMVESFIVYGLGRDVEFTDDPYIKKIMSRIESSGYRIRDMIHAVAESPLFFRN